VLLHEFLEESARTYSNKIALVQKEERWTYRAIDEKANQVAHLLRNQGIQRGDRVAILLDDSPEDTDPNSTNCLMNAFANQIHQEQNGFHPYSFEIAGLVRMGVFSREEGLNRLNQPGNPVLIGRVKERLGI